MGLAAWMYAIFQVGTDSDGDPERVLSYDMMLDGILMYWLRNTAASSIRLNWEATQERLSAPHRLL